jgi:hypothetical protein
MLRHVAHVVFGLLTSICSIVSPILSIINTAVFIIYELDQERYKKDAVYEELLEFAIGLGIGEVILLVLYIIKNVL